MTLRYLLGAVVAGGLGAACLVASAYERHDARARQHLASLDYAAADVELAKVERYAGYVSPVPIVGPILRRDVAARRAALRYWRRDYVGLVPPGTDPVAALPADNVPLQLVVANAVYRAGRSRARDPKSTLVAIDAGMAAYLSVLRNAEQQQDAAFNYEYLVRLRSAINGNRRPGNGDGEAGNASPHGLAAAPPADTDMSRHRIHIPLEAQELDQQKEGETAGRVAPRRRRG